MDAFDDEFAVHAHLDDVVFEVVDESVDDGLHLIEGESALFGLSEWKVIIEAKYDGLLGVGFHILGDVFDAMFFVGIDVDDKFIWFEFDGFYGVVLVL